MIFKEIGAEWEIKWKRLRIPKDRNEREQLITEYIKRIEEWRKQKKQEKIKSYAKPVTPRVRSDEEIDREMIREALQKDPLLRFVMLEYPETRFSSIDEITVIDVISNVQWEEMKINAIKQFLRERGGRAKLKEIFKAKDEKPIRLPDDKLLERVLAYMRDKKMIKIEGEGRLVNRDVVLLDWEDTKIDVW